MGRARSGRRACALRVDRRTRRARRRGIEGVAGAAGVAGVEPADRVATFDAADDEVLRRLAERSRLQRARREEPIGNVVFLHGITGSDLSSPRAPARRAAFG